MDEQFMCDFRTGSGNSAKFARIYDMGFSKYILNFTTVYVYMSLYSAASGIQLKP